MSRTYGVTLEIAGQLAMFGDPTTIPDATSYPVPPPTACAGIIQAVRWQPGVEIIPVAVGVCSEIVYAPYGFNNRYGLVNKQSLIKDRNACQLHTTVLFRPRFQIVAVLRNTGPGAFNAAHRMQCMLMAALHRGRPFHAVSLGQRNFLANYVGIQKTPVLGHLNFTIPLMHLSNSDNRDYRINVQVTDGICVYDDRVPVTATDGIVQFCDADLQRQVHEFRTNWRRANKGKS